MHFSSGPSDDIQLTLDALYKSMSSHYHGIISNYEKGREMSAVEKSCFMTSHSEGIKTEIKSSK